MKLILPAQLRGELAACVGDAAVAWIDNEGSIEGDPSDALVYFRWWTGRRVLEMVLERAPDLRWLHTPAAGVENVLIPALRARPITLTNSAGVHALPIAEFVLAFMLAHAKQFDLFRTAQAESRWAQEFDPQELHAATLLVIGAGGIGQAIIERARPFGMRVLASRQRPRPMAGVELVVGGDGWRDLLPEADYVVLATPLTDVTRGMFDAAAFARMKPSAYLINIARGAIVDEGALVAALHAGQIGGAALDAFEQEPLPSDSPLWQVPNLTITPHATAYSPRMRERQVALFLDNLARFRAGEPLLNVVDQEAGY